MTQKKTPTEVATGVGLVIAVAAAVVLLASLAVPVLGQPGLWLLFAVPIARNLAVVAVGAGTDRVMAAVGVVVVGAVIGFVLFA
jgi:hypothetical protein